MVDRMSDLLLGHSWHAAEVTEVEERLGTSGQGLTSTNAAARLERDGPNVLPEEEPPSATAVFLRQFASPLIVILIIAGAVTLALGELIDTAMITLALLLNAVIGFTQERRAAGAVQALMQLVVPRCHVVRDGRDMEIDSRDLVLGDLVLLEPGSRVPADLRLRHVNGLTVDESLLTGESLPVLKHPDPVDEDAAPGDRRSMGFTGSIVASGRGQGYVVAVGLDTELGAIADQIRGEDAMQTPLQIRMQSFARVIAVSVLVAAAITFVSGILLGNSVSSMFRTAVAMAVSAVPEALPVATTVTLAIGVSRVARRNAVLRRPPALETLGSTLGDPRRRGNPRRGAVPAAHAVRAARRTDLAGGVGARHPRRDHGARRGRGTQGDTSTLAEVVNLEEQRVGGGALPVGERAVRTRLT